MKRLGSMGSWVRRVAALMLTCGVVLAAATGHAAHAAGVPPPLVVMQADIPVIHLVDISNGQVLYSRNATRRFVPASVTKVMTLYTAFEMIAAGELDPDASMAVTPEAWEGWRAKGSSMFLEAGDVVPLADLLTGIATVSANDAAYVVAEQAAGSLAGWTALMNARARGLGMTQSHFGTPNGWPDEGRTFTTAHDLVILAKALVERHPEQFARFIGQREYRYRDITQPNRDPLIGRVAGADGIKTGYTNEAGYNFLGTAQRGGQRLVVVIAGADRGSTRAKAARDLIEWGFAAFDRKALFDKGAVVGTARVQDGSLRSLDLVAERAVAVNVPKGAGADMRVEIVYEGPLRAPIRAGETVAMLEVTAPDMEPARIPLLAARDIGQAGLLSRIANAFAGWLG